MSQKRKNLIGEKFGKLVVIDYGKVTRKGAKHIRYYYICKCDCGNIKQIREDALKSGQQSCGCILSTNPSGLKHGLSQTRLYRVFRDMKTRCYNKNSLVNKTLTQFRGYLACLGSNPHVPTYCICEFWQIINTLTSVTHFPYMKNGHNNSTYCRGLYKVKRDSKCEIQSPVLDKTFVLKK